MLNGGRFFVSNAWLHEDLIPEGRRGRSRAPLGTGLDSSSMLARHKALSEAIERWAFLTKIEEEPHAYGFDRDPSSNGMCAFPGVRHASAREGALAEAIEHFCISLWWIGALSHEMLLESGKRSPQLVRIHNPFTRHVVMLAFGRAENGLVAYGTGAGMTVDQASAKASSEQAVGRLSLELIGGPSGDVPAAQLERSNYLVKRLIYFSQPNGHVEFMERISEGPTCKPFPPSTIFDGEIRGPWSRFATVWRVAFEPASPDFLDSSRMFFFF